MRGILIRVLINALGIWLAAYLISGVHLEPGPTVLIASLILAVANAIVRPLLILFTLPLTILTLGLFLLFINAVVIALVAKLVPGFTIDGWGSAFLAWLVVSIVGWLTSSLIVDDDR